MGLEKILLTIKEKHNLQMSEITILMLACHLEDLTMKLIKVQSLVGNSWRPTPWQKNLKAQKWRKTVAHLEISFFRKEMLKHRQLLV